MASKAFLIALAVVAAIVAPTRAKEIVVGGKDGWMLGMDYQAWADGIEFHVGDTLVFNYKPGAHNVIKVNGTEFKLCAAPLGAAPLTSGHDVITLAAPGRKWYICGVADHCHTGPMKFAITVQPGLGSPSPAPALTPPKPDAGAATGFGPSKTFSWLIAALAAFMMIMA
ncbi:mavicyanin-like [Coffea eugenioides]|uniref:mavicyanin-like n=1 Tax=Coffea eugenioides TaxID=49369 RepID=UPI000F610F60|nr:mavicyanin-like [Coffea eugenioides]